MKISLEEYINILLVNTMLNESVQTMLFEAVYQGRNVKLYKIMRGDVSKFKVYVNSGKKDKEGNIIAKKLNFGHGGSSAKAKGEKTMSIFISTNIGKNIEIKKLLYYL